MQLAVKKKKCWREYWFAKKGPCYVTAREFASIVRHSGRSHVSKCIHYKLSSWKNAPKFCQFVGEHPWINARNADYQRKLGVIALYCSLLMQKSTVAKNFFNLASTSSHVDLSHTLAVFFSHCTGEHAASCPGEERQMGKSWVHWWACAMTWNTFISLLFFERTPYFKACSAGMSCCSVVAVVTMHEPANSTGLWVYGIIGWEKSERLLVDFKYQRPHAALQCLAHVFSGTSTSDQQPFWPCSKSVAGMLVRNIKAKY